MYEIGQLSGYEYVDTYATKKAEDIPIDVAHVAVVRRRRARSRPRCRVELSRSSRAQSRERSTARCQVAMPRRASAASIAGVNDASAFHVALTVAGRVPHAFGDAGEERGAERRRLLDRGAAHRHAEQVGLELAQQVHHRRAAVDAHLGRRACRSPRVIASTTSAVWNAIASTTARARCARVGAARDADDRAARVRVPPRRAEPGERGHDVDAAGVGDRLGERSGLGRVGDDARARRAATAPRRR